MYGRRVTFYPDGEVRIPHEKSPVPPAAAPDDPGAAARRFSRLMFRTALINGVILVAAVLLAYVFPVSDDENVALGIVIVAAVVCAAHMSWVVLGETRRRARAFQATKTGLYPG
ncbi:hypothetical protein GCM10023221_31410 [Luteimicrobium xylanilyticum]|uniref:Uncharacterized protein n=1 Tax=Luteimicrobium xylanilyticum TaxID=1133546 RepID=A0A5P9Q644_9MICO|nr:hypothetical protein KDY119_00054 [Luteimicrobium xylanilyticum]